MRYIIFPIILITLTVFAAIKHLSQMPDGGGIGALFVLVVAGAVGLFSGLLFAFYARSNKKAAYASVATWVVISTIYIAYAHVRYEIYPDCVKTVKYEFRKNLDVALLDKWCVSKDDTAFLQKAERRIDKSLFDDILAKGFHHPNIECAQLKFAVHQGKVDLVEKWINEGVLPECRSFKHELPQLFRKSKRNVYGFSKYNRIT